jgi:hypothetical protein
MCKIQLFVAPLFFLIALANPELIWGTQTEGGTDLASTNTKACCADTYLTPELRIQLLDRYALDQEVRVEFTRWSNEHGMMGQSADMSALTLKQQEKLAEMIGKEAEIDRDNEEWLKKIVNQGGWPLISEVGADGAKAAFTLVQHAGDSKFQEKCLIEMKNLPLTEVHPRAIAYLTDRLLIKAGKKQIYGTQLMFSNDKFVPMPLQDPENMDQLRESLGLIPMNEYLAKATKEIQKITEANPEAVRVAENEADSSIKQK